MLTSALFASFASHRQRATSVDVAQETTDIPELSLCPKPYFDSARTAGGRAEGSFLPSGSIANLFCDSWQGTAGQPQPMRCSLRDAMQHGLRNKKIYLSSSILLSCARNTSRKGTEMQKVSTSAMGWHSSTPVRSITRGRVRIRGMKQTP